MLNAVTDAAVDILGEFFSLADTVRRFQGDALGALGFGPEESGYRLLASGPQWRLRD
jgi:hypothetical protein